MDAFFVRNRLSAYLDGELDAAEAREVELALKQDAELRAEFDRLRMAVELLRSHGVVNAPEGFAERVAARAAEERMPSRWTRGFRSMRAEVWLAAAASLLVVSYLGFNHDDLNPDAANVEAAKVATPGATEKPEEQTQEEQPEDEAIEPAGASGDAADGEAGNSWVGSKNDGDLGERPEKRKVENLVPTPIPGKSGAQYAPDGAPTKAAPSKASASKGGAEKEPYYPEWEKEQPVAKEAVIGATQTLYAPAPFRYRLQTVDDAVLRQLAELAASLGGRLEDKSGRPLTPYLMSDGDMRDVRIVVPSYNTAALAQKLRAFGEVDTIVTKDNLVVQPGAEVPVQIDVRR